MVTAAVRDFKIAHPDVDISVNTLHMPLWDNNPYITNSSRRRLSSRITVDYSAYINIANQAPGHFVTKIHKWLERITGLTIPVTLGHGDIHMSADEVNSKPITDKPYWIIVCGGKTDFTTKWWNYNHANKVVENLSDRFDFVQIGGKPTGVYPEHVNFPLNGVINMIGDTSIRDLIKLIYHSEGVICPVTFPMHLAAAIPNKDGTAKKCVVIAGGREPPHWEAYPGHRFLHTVQKLDCCKTGGCWARRAQLVNDGQPWNNNQLCVKPVQIDPELRIAQCMHDIDAEAVITAVNSYYNKIKITIGGKEYQC